MKFIEGEEVRYIGPESNESNGELSTIIEINGTPANPVYVIRTFFYKSQRPTRLLHVTENELEYIPQYVYRIVGKRGIIDRLYRTIGAARGMATRQSKPGTKDYRVQQAEVIWKDV
jgi:hypothetical protein